MAVLGDIPDVDDAFSFLKELEQVIPEVLAGRGTTGAVDQILDSSSAKLLEEVESVMPRDIGLI